MDSSPSSTKLSGIPRFSRLPVPRPAVRPTASREHLQQAQKPSGIQNPRLRNAPSRDQLPASTTSRPRVPSTPVKTRDSISALPRDRNISGGSLTPNARRLSRRSSHDVLFRKPSQTFFGEPSMGGSIRESEEAVMEDSMSIEDFEEKDGAVRSRKPSLAERTMETLQTIPSSPAVKRRTSSFYGTDSTRPTSSGRVSSRPGSSQQVHTLMRPPSQSSSRPASRAGQSQYTPQLDFRASTNTFPPPSTGNVFSQGQSARTGPGRLAKKPSNIQSSFPQTPNASMSISKLPSPIFSVSPRDRSPSPAKQHVKALPLKAGSKTSSARSLKPRASVNGLFQKPFKTTLDQGDGLDRIELVQKRKTATLSNTSSEANSTTSRKSSGTTTTTLSPGNDETATKKSSSALRDQIAKAKAAKRAVAAKEAGRTLSQEDEIPVIASGTFDFGLPSDPFNQGANENGAKGLLRKRIELARTDGRLNIAAMSLKEIPEEVMNMYNLEAAGANGGSWAESVDLTRLIAADNELEVIHGDIFPDVDPRDNVDDDEAKGNQFGGLETLDLHGNLLKALPIGLRRLELLTTVNLSSNKLGNDCFDILCQLTSLRDLKMGSNALSGSLDSRMANLQNLEVLDIQRNAVTHLPIELSSLPRLRILNFRENKVESLSFESLRQLPLVELLASKNKLSGVLVSDEVEELEHLQVLDVACNSLTTFTSGTLRLPSLHQLDCSSNRLIELPDVTTWVSLLTIAAEDNNISALPTGFPQLPKVKNVDFNGNNLKILDDEIGAMVSLHTLRISGNPLREKKFASMSTEELKRALKARLAPSAAEADKDVDAESAFYSAPNSPLSPRPSSSDWPVLDGKTLDRSNTQSHSLNPVTAAHVASTNSIKALELHHNRFETIPNSIAFFAMTLTSLNLAHNELTGDMFMKDDLDLPVLQELNLSSNTFNSLQPLFQYLNAPQLARLDISFNRLTSLPILRQHFPNLVHLFASHNTIRELSPESVKGLRTLDCSSNDINSLNARIGLLGGPGGLERLDVSNNRFRVPKYTILEKGTETTLAWLRDRIPTNEASTDVD